MFATLWFRQVFQSSKTLKPILKSLRTDFPKDFYTIRKICFSSFPQCIHVPCASRIFAVKNSKQRIPGGTRCSTHSSVGGLLEFHCYMLYSVFPICGYMDLHLNLLQDSITKAIFYNTLQTTTLKVYSFTE